MTNVWQPQSAGKLHVARQTLGRAGCKHCQVPLGSSDAQRTVTHRRPTSSASFGLSFVRSHRLRSLKLEAGTDLLLMVSATLYDTLHNLPGNTPKPQRGGVSSADGQINIRSVQLVELAATLANYLRSTCGIEPADVLSLVSSNSVPISPALSLACYWLPTNPERLFQCPAGDGRRLPCEHLLQGNSCTNQQEHAAGSHTGPPAVLVCCLSLT